VYVFDNERVGNWVTEKAGGKFYPGNIGFGIEVDGILKAGIMYDSYTGIGGSISSHFRCDDPCIITRKFYWMAFDYAFNIAQVNRITNLVNEHNIHSRAITSRLGFTEECTLEKYFPDGNAIIYRMFRQECRWLKNGESK
jgi:hypothetical protein